MREVLSGIRERSHVHVEHNREKAIAVSVKSAGTGDLVLVAGKGHESYQEVRGKRRPFSDIETVQQIMRGERS